MQAGPSGRLGGDLDAWALHPNALKSSDNSPRVPSGLPGPGPGSAASRQAEPGSGHAGPSATPDGHRSWASSGSVGLTPLASGGLNGGGASPPSRVVPVVSCNDGGGTAGGGASASRATGPGAAVGGGGGGAPRAHGGGAPAVGPSGYAYGLSSSEAESIRAWLKQLPGGGQTMAQVATQDALNPGSRATDHL
jgi:hypothetical protein